MAEYKDVAIEGTTYFWVALNDTSGSGADLDSGNLDFDVRLAGATTTDAPIYSSTGSLLSHASYPAGCYELAVACTTANGFAAGNEYAVFATGLVDSENPVGLAGSIVVTAASDTLHDAAARVMDVTDTAAVKAVTGNVGGNVVGSVGSVTGAVGSVTGNVGGNVVGSVGSVTGAVGSVTGNVGGSTASVVGAVGSVTGNVGGNVAGSVGSVTGAVGSVTGNVGGSVASVTGAVGSVTADVDANLVSILGTALTETAGYIAAGFKKLFNVAAPVLTMESVNQTGDAYAAVGGLNNFNPASDTVANVTTVGSVSGSVGSVTGAVGSVTGAVGSVTGAVGSVGAGGIDAAAFAADTDTYQAKVDWIDDETNSTDRYVVAWYKNAEPVTSGITSPLLQVVNTATAADLIAASAMTEIGSTGLYRYQATTTERQSNGVAYYAKVTATIGGSARTWYQPVGRDSTA